VQSSSWLLAWGFAVSCFPFDILFCKNNKPSRLGVLLSFRLGLARAQAAVWQWPGPMGSHSLATEGEFCCLLIGPVAVVFHSCLGWQPLRLVSVRLGETTT
jgi:hypothetical protein